MSVYVKTVESPRPLRTCEIDRQIEALAVELIGDRDESDCQPRWISAGEFVGRMKSTLCDN